MAIVTVPEFQNYMSGVRMTPVQEQSAQTILDGVQSELESYLNRPVQVHRLQELVSVRDGAIYPRVTPIQHIYSLSHLDQSGNPGPPIKRFTNNSIFQGKNFIEYGRYYGYGSYGYGFTDRVLLDYAAGINGDKHPGLKTAILRVASREFTGKLDGSMTIQNLDGRTPDSPEPTVRGWTEDELKKFDRLRRRVVV